MFFLFFIVESIKNLLKCKSLVQICIFRTNDRLVETKIFSTLMGLLFILRYNVTSHSDRDAIFRTDLLSICCAVRCDNNKSQKTGLTFHYTPQNTERRETWIAAIKRYHWTSTEHYRLCSEHFVSGKQLNVS